MSIPVTRPITIVVHEQVFPQIRSLADEMCHGSVSRAVRLLLYAEMLRRGLIDMSLIRELDGEED